VTRIRVTLVPHTHWDREWYLPFEAFLERLVEMMDGLIDLLDAGFPHFHLDGQTAMIDDYIAVRPERAADVERLARAGKISTGPWFTQMDEFLTSGESHIRNLERGLARAAELGGRPPIGYLPDQFGHIGQMPQILTMQGIDRAVVWRGVPREIDRTVFWWESPDGSRIRTEYLAFGYFLGGQFRDARDADDLAGRLRDAAERLGPMSAGDRLLVMVGADHHGPDPDLPGRIEDAAKLTPELEARIGSLADHAVDGSTSDVPVWRGELRSSARAHLLPNVYSARVHQKRERARIEALLERYAEPLAAMVPGLEWPADDLDRAWQLLLWNGAHDSVCGCSHDDVARAVDARHEEAHRIAGEVVGRALVALGEQVSSSGELVFNPSPFERRGIPGLGWAHALAPLPAPSGTQLELEARREWLRAGGVRFRLLDEPDVGDLYNFCPAEHASPMGPNTIDLDGRRADLSFGRDLSVRLQVSNIGEVETQPFLGIHGVITSARPNHRLRLHVALPEPVDRVVAGSPFELVGRGLVSEGSDIEPPSRTWPARGVLLAGETALLAEGVVEYEIVDGRELAVTLQRAVGAISRQSLATRPWPAGPDVPTPEAQMTGDTEFKLAVLTRAGRDDLLNAWERFALPLISREARGGGVLPDRGTLLEVKGAELSAIRRINGHIEVRVWNSSTEPRVCHVAGRRIELRPVEIATVETSTRPTRSRMEAPTAGTP
jgi:Glycosyl hydrolases family 38 N-terminal domain/Alpha mannosidase middle domain